MRLWTISGMAAGAMLALLTSGLAFAQDAPVTASRLIIKLRPEIPAAAAESATTDSRRQTLDRQHRLDALAGRSGLKLRGARELGGGMASLILENRLTGTELDRQLSALQADPDVEFAEVDQRRFAQAMPSDPLYASQWYLQGIEPAATNFAAAWDLTTGTPDTVIAVVDTGIRHEHPDLAGRVLPGYDFVSGESSSSFVSANDGNGWDADASDPGDWISSADKQSGPLADDDDCELSSSSWHGTRIAGLLAAKTSNGIGIAGGTWQGSILPVRVLGKCGGWDSDIIAGMRWAAGLRVTGAPLNPNPARIINLSLGSADKCTAAYKTALTQLTAAGVLVVASAGNDSGPVETPANCSGALAVAGLRHVGTKVGYSSFGPEIALAAPAGNCPDQDTTFRCSYSLITTSNAGQTVPGASNYTDEFHANIGTSFSSPIVSAIAGLMHAANDKLTLTEWTERLKAGTRPFPPPEPGLPTCPATSTDEASLKQCNCTTTTCGAGMADAPAAVARALLPMARIASITGSGAGQNVRLDGSASDAARNRVLAQYAWTPVSGSPAFIGATNEPVATVAVPASGRVTVRLTVTDDIGHADSREVTLGESSSGGGGSGGGGGALHPLMLLALGLLAGWHRRRSPG